MGLEFNGKIVALLQGSEVTAGFHYKNWILGICFRLIAMNIY